MSTNPTISHGKYDDKALDRELRDIINAIKGLQASTNSTIATIPIELVIDHRGDDPTSPKGNQLRAYLKGNYVVFQVNISGTIGYYYFDATDTGASQSILYSATAP